LQCLFVCLSVCLSCGLNRRRRVPCARGHSVQPSTNAFSLFFIIVSPSTVVLCRPMYNLPIYVAAFTIFLSRIFMRFISWSASLQSVLKCVCQTSSRNCNRNLIYCLLLYILRAQGRCRYRGMLSRKISMCISVEATWILPVF